MIAHRLSTLENSDVKIELAKGRITALSTARQVSTVK